MKLCVVEQRGPGREFKRAKSKSADVGRVEEESCLGGRAFVGCKVG